MRIVRDQDAIAAAAAQRLARQRQTAFVTKREFCLALAPAGILTAEDTLLAAKGEWPTALADFLPLLDDAQKLDAQVEWATLTIVERMHPLVLTLASWMSLPDEAVDALFGIEL